MKPTVFIAAAGPPRAQIKTIAHKTKSAAMVPVNGKPIIGWMLDYLIKQDFMDFVLLIPAKDNQFRNYIEHRYKGARTIKLLEVEDSEYPKGLAHSLKEGINQLCKVGGIESEERLLYERTVQYGILLILGHTICKFSEFINDTYFIKDFVLYHPVTTEISRWCYVETNDNDVIIGFDDKPNDRENLEKALIGVYYFKNVKLLNDSLGIALKESSSAYLSRALERYIENSDIHAVKVPDGHWFDCGNVLGFNKTKTSMFDVRVHNPIQIDAEKGILKKTNDNPKDLHEEYMWYLGLPNELLTFAPRIIDFNHKNEMNECAQMSLEYYGYPTIAEAWIYDNWDINIWYWVVEKLLHISRVFREYTAELTAENYRAIYWGKTLHRIEIIYNQSGQLRALFDEKEIYVNGVVHLGWESLKKRITPRIDDLYNGGNHTTIIHGDFHFGNILFDVYTRLVKLIDPRGNFGVSGIFGDCKYDLAKLRHSISGGYNFISHDLYNVKIKNTNSIEFTLPYTNDHKKIVTWFDEKIEQEGFLIDDIKLIEGLLFISMLPLHNDHQDRQKALFARGIMLLNEVVNDNKDSIAQNNYDEVYKV